MKNESLEIYKKIKDLKNKNLKILNEHKLYSEQTDNLGEEYEERVMIYNEYQGNLGKDLLISIGLNLSFFIVAGVFIATVSVDTFRKIVGYILAMGIYITSYNLFPRINTTTYITKLFLNLFEFEKTMDIFEGAIDNKESRIRFLEEEYYRLCDTIKGLKKELYKLYLSENKSAVNYSLVVADESVKIKSFKIGKKVM